MSDQILYLFSEVKSNHHSADWAFFP